MELRTAPIHRYAWISREYNVWLALLFVAMLALPALGWWFGWQGAVLEENRNLAPVPDFRHGSLATLPAAIDAYYDDHVGFRGAMIRLLGLTLHQMLHQTSERVIIGKSPGGGEPRWYFYASEGIVEDRLGLGQFSSIELENWKRSLESRAAWLQRRGIAYLFVVMPEKSSVYPELLPDYLRNQLGPTRRDQLREHLKANRSPVHFLDVNERLTRVKSDGLLFFPFDTHWNGMAAFHTYRAIWDEMRAWISGLPPRQMGRDFEIRMAPETLRVGLASMLGLKAAMPTPVLAYIGPDPPKAAAAKWPDGLDHAMNPSTAISALETASQRGRLLVFHDSAFVAGLFTPESQPLATGFARSYFAWLPPSDLALRRFVEMEHPDLVVEEQSEHLLRLTPPPPAPLDPVTPSLTRAPGAPAFSIERINTKRARPDAAVARNGELRIEGWAFDQLAGRPAGGVELTIDGVAHAASYGGLAPAGELSPPTCDGCRYVRFLGDYPVIGLSIGPHILGIRVISASGANYSEVVWGRFVVK